MVKKKIKIEFVNTFHHLDFPLSEYRDFIQQIVRHEKIPVGLLRIIAVDDEYLRSLHRQFVRDDSYTDVMVFPIDDQVDKEAEVYISGERAKTNAKRYRVTLKKEIARLIGHALLHLQGFDDSTQAARKIMYALENQLLRKYWKSVE